ncbi:MAG: FKBP-type peptidyl-prolyl cis-trans isomerase [Bacteroidota bacterium]|nr:FKBP-type peptidyl-prolyl cis-trans isomerase [Bacteroidota bacterium]
MKIVFLVFLFPVSVLYAQTKKPVTKHKVVPPKVATAMTSTDSLSYAIGVQVAEYYKTQGVEKVNAEYVKKAFNDVFNNKTLTISEEECNMNIQNKLQEFMARKISADKEAGIKFLEENKKRPGVITLPSGLQYEIITKGTGPIPKATDTVKANYMGSLIDGKEFDNSYKRGEPITIPVTGVIKGWTEALQMMPVGSKWKLFIPSDLGYGDRGAGGVIPGGAALIFDIELLDIVNK